ncbi:hypothetical protein ACGF12_29655 [Kitasatospora sp. NPDC048296]|uniref:hypothetical protein n=1 Tax=Kitasatospora sp. NPDC048296 TaxID=3364048 RepID=UPI0037167483
MNSRTNHTRWTRLVAGAALLTTVTIGVDVAPAFAAPAPAAATTAAVAPAPLPPLDPAAIRAALDQRPAAEVTSGVFATRDLSRKVVYSVNPTGLLGAETPYAGRLLVTSFGLTH